MSWFYLILAGVLEAVWAVGLKYTDGFTRLWPSLVVGTAIAGSMILLSLALRTIPIGVGYSMWVGIGVLGAVISGPVLFSEPLRPVQVLFVGLLVVAIVGLKFTGGPQ